MSDWRDINDVFKEADRAQDEAYTRPSPYKDPGPAGGMFEGESVQCAWCDRMLRTGQSYATHAWRRHSRVVSS